MKTLRSVESIEDLALKLGHEISEAADVGFEHDGPGEYEARRDYNLRLFELAIQWQRNKILERALIAGIAGNPEPLEKIAMQLGATPGCFK